MTQSKGTKRKSKPTITDRGGRPMHLYMGVFDNVHIDIVGTDAQEAKEALLKWLDNATNSYELKKFYLAKDDAWE